MNKTCIIALLFLGGAAQAGSKYPYLPNPALTPGVVASTNTELICASNYPAAVRNVSAAKKKKVYSVYNVDKDQCVKGCKIDHLIPLSIGGSNDIGNLWPHEYGAERNVYSKTRLEVRLRKEVCTGRMPIIEAQACIQQSWTSCYDKFYNNP